MKIGCVVRLPNDVSTRSSPLFHSLLQSKNTNQIVTPQGTSDRGAWCGGLNPFSTMGEAELAAFDVEEAEVAPENKEGEGAVEVATNAKLAFGADDDGMDMANPNDGDEMGGAAGGGEGGGEVGKDKLPLIEG